MFTEVAGGEGSSNRCCSSVVGSRMVHDASSVDHRCLVYSPNVREFVSRESSSSKRPRTGKDSSLARKMLLRDVSDSNLSVEAENIFLASWKPATRRLYYVYIVKWITFCVERGRDYNQSDLRHVYLFLSYLFKKGLSASANNVARSALPQVDGVPVGQCRVISRQLKGVNKLLPQRSRYLSNWDTDIVLEYLQQCSPWSLLTFRELTENLTMLFLLCSSQRIQTL